MDPDRPPPRPRPTDATRWWPTAAVCAGVIAACYGFARYAYGLFVPEFAVDFGLTATGIGVLGAVSTLGYTVGLVVAPRVADADPRVATLTSAGCAASGLTLMGASGPAPVAFAVGLALAGAGAGLASPAVAELVSRSVARTAHTRAQSWANTGTGIGLAASAFTPALAIGWGPTWLGFGSAAAAVMVIAWLTLPRPTAPEPRGRHQTAGRPRRWRAGTAVLLVDSVLLGLTSGPYWTFSVERVLQTGLDPAITGWFWLTIGLAGLAGGVVGTQVNRYGLTVVNVAVWTLWAGGAAVLALPAPGTTLVLVSAAVFGATFMGLSGLCILWAAALYPESPARGVTLSFLALGAGQALGSPAAGLLADRTSLGVVFIVTAALSLATWAQAHPRLRAPGR